MALTVAQAFLIQARSDFEAYEVVRKSDVLPECHWLHFLQMACEKLAKAYQAAAGADFATVSASHGSFAKFAGRLYRDYAARYLADHLSDRTQKLSGIVSLARELYLVHQALDREARPDNCEYPWVDLAGNVVSPVQFRFDIARRLVGDRSGMEFLKFVQIAIRDLGSSLQV